jgi:ribosomal-protein-alanine N-acetyltransferase
MNERIPMSQPELSGRTSARTPGIRFEPVTEANVREVLTWRYEPPYDFYNPPLELSDADLAAMLAPESPHFAVLDESGTLVGFIGLGREARVPGGDYSAPALDVGVGLRPDWTGRGVGHLVLTRFFAHLDALGYPPAPLRATIAAFNLRSQRTFLRLGFRETAHFQSGTASDPMDWVIMVRPSSAGPG